MPTESKRDQLTPAYAALPPPAAFKRCTRASVATNGFHKSIDSKEQCKDRLSSRTHPLELVTYKMCHFRTRKASIQIYENILDWTMAEGDKLYLQPA